VACSSVVPGYSANVRRSTSFVSVAALMSGMPSTNSSVNRMFLRATNMEHQATVCASCKHGYLQEHVRKPVHTQRVVRGASSSTYSGESSSVNVRSMSLGTRGAAGSLMAPSMPLALKPAQLEYRSAMRELEPPEPDEPPSAAEGGEDASELAVGVAGAG